MPGLRTTSATLLAVGLLTAAPGSARQDAVQRFAARVGDCRVLVLSPAAGGGAGRSNAFLIERAGRRVLVAPFPGVLQALASSSPPGRSAAPDVIVLTTLDERQLVPLDEPETGGVEPSALVDDALLGAAFEADAAAPVPLIAALRSRHRLRTVAPNVEILPGVRIAIDPRRPRRQSRLKVACGATTLLVLDGEDLPVDVPTTPAGERRIVDLGLPLAIASDAYVIAATTGRYPALGRMYRFADGYRWGSVRASMSGGDPAVRGHVLVEPAGQTATSEPASDGLVVGPSDEHRR